MYGWLIRALAWFMRPLLVGLAWLFGSKLRYWIVSLFLFFGLQFAVQTIAVDQLSDYVQQALTGMAGDLASGIAFIKIPNALSVILSAYSVKAGLSAGRVFLWKQGVVA